MKIHLVAKEKCFGSSPRGEGIAPGLRLFELKANVFPKTHVNYCYFVTLSTASGTGN